MSVLHDTLGFGVQVVIAPESLEKRLFLESQLLGVDVGEVSDSEYMDGMTSQKIKRLLT